MKKIRTPVRIALSLTLSILLFFTYIHTTKKAIIASITLEPNQNGVSVNLQNPYIMPIKVFHTKVVDAQDKEVAAKAYNVILSGVYGGSTSSINQEFMAQKTDVFEELDEVTIPSDTANTEKNYSLYMISEGGKGSFPTASKVSVSFKVFHLIPFKTTVSL